jgi:hypothetical protein
VARCLWGFLLLYFSSQIPGTILGRETLGITQNQETNIKSYAKYVLKEGAKEEKRELLTCLKTKLYLKDGSIVLRKASQK